MSQTLSINSTIMNSDKSHGSDSNKTISKSKTIFQSTYQTFRNVKFEHLVAGVSGGVASTLALHPLDLLKIRLAVNSGQVIANRPQYSGLINAISTTFKQEGPRGFYRGVIPNCWGAGASWGFYFLFYNAIKSHMSNHDPTINLHATQHIIAASESGILTLLLTNPIWVVKTRFCLQFGDSNKSKSSQSSSVKLNSNGQAYTGMLQALKKIYAEEGILGLYRGFVPGVFGVSHGALQFMAYEEMKKYYYQPYFTCAVSSKLFAVLITYPYQVIRARLQDRCGNFNGAIDVITKTWSLEGTKGFYKGLVPNLLRVTPACAITLVVYENISHFLAQSRSKTNAS
ncbi:Mitochondrial folate transporter/carrier [Sarcoptes scabiei]|uniref:Solute carrier family 25 member 32 n=1 Tax=Sarcoptes scabiei TaxID=52283 RepID=A0A834RBR2_SARSC|nr:Mitochondrial folate transporter/carrier [Sarcoptes scabiei]